MLLYDYLKGVPGRRLALAATLKTQGPFWLLGLGYLAVVRQGLGTALLDSPVRTFGVQINTQLKALVYYIKLLWMPQGLNVEHQFILGQGFFDLPVLAAAVLLLVGLGLVWRCSDGGGHGVF